VEHPCHRCNAAVKDGSPFCQSCGAPQIRVLIPEAQPEAVAAASDAPIDRVGSRVFVSQQRNQINWHVAVRSAATGGATAAAFSFLPLGRAFVLVLPLAGFLCVALYRRRSLQEPSRGVGFQLGALSGLIGSAIFFVLTALQALVFHAQDQLRDAMVQAIRQAQARSTDPQAKQMLDYFMTPQGLMVMMIFGFIFTVIVFVLLSGLGGAVSAAIFRRKRPLE
jgi:hypothetical protein